jgi:PAS domain S-box-containing protein
MIMNEDFFPSFDPNELMTKATAMFFGILDPIPLAIEGLRAIRKDEKIVDFVYVFLNKEAKNISGINLEGNTFLALQGSRHLYETMINVVSTGITDHTPVSLMTDGKEISYNVTCVKLGDGVLLYHEKKGGIVAPVSDPRSDLALENDVSEIQKARKIIKEDEHLITQIMDTTPDIIYIMDLDTNRVIYSNRQIAEELGYSKQQVRQMKNPIFDILFEDDVSPMIEHFKKIKTLDSDDQYLEIEYRMKNAKGGLSWFCDRNSIFKKNNQETPVETIGITQNITKRKLQEQQNITSHDILTQAEEIAGIGSWEYDISTANFKWSEGMYRLFNLPADTIVTPDIYFDYTSHEENGTIGRIVNNIRRDYKPFEEIITLLPSKQEKKIVRIKAIVTRDKKKKPIKVIGVDMDITHQVKAEEEIVALNDILVTKNRDLETLNSELRTFNTIASRDYKETIQILYTNLEYIASKEARNLSDAAKGNIRKAQGAIQKMKLLTEDINDYLYLYDLGTTKSWIDPNIILANVLSGMKGRIEQTGAQIESPELPLLPADPLLFSQLLIRLIDNAIKFRKLIVVPVIKIKYSKADELNAMPDALKNVPYIIIAVSDNGIGFSDDDSEKIFELFFRLHDKSKYKGSGIGLAICKKIMIMHGGFITAESSPAHGATFTCYFPVTI